MSYRFLQKSNTYAALQPAQAHVTVSLSCVLYLASSLKFVDPNVAERDIRDQVIQRFHELLLYACDHWLDHLQALADTPTRLSVEQYTLSSLQQNLESLSQIWKMKIYGRYAALPKDLGSMGIVRPIYIGI